MNVRVTDELTVGFAERGRASARPQGPHIERRYRSVDRRPGDIDRL